MPPNGEVLRSVQLAMPLIQIEQPRLRAIVMPSAPSRRVNHDAEIHARFFEVSECGPLIIFYYIWMFPEYALADS